MAADEAATNLRAYLATRERNGYANAFFDETDLLALLDEREQLAARLTELEAEDPGDTFQTARRRYHNAIAAAHNQPTYAGTIAAMNTAIDDYNQAVDAYNAHYGLAAAADDPGLGRRCALEHLPSVSDDGDAITHRTEGRT